MDSRDATESSATATARRWRVPRAPRSRPAGRLLEAADATARRHPTAVAAALFCGGLATGTWLARARRREAAGEALGILAGRTPPPPAGGAGEPAAPPAGPTRAASITRLRNPIGATTVLQR